MVADAVAVLDGRARSRFHRLVVGEVVRETAEAVTLVFHVPEAMRSLFAYRAGQFVNVRVVVDGEPLIRSYSMSSAPRLDDRLRVTVKRVPGGVVSNWIAEHVVAGCDLEVTPPSGTFVADDAAGDLIGIAAGSGITPVFSLVRSALAAGARRVSLLYANRDRESVIFGAELDRLVTEHPDRLRVVHHLDVDAGFVTTDEVRAFAAEAGSGEVFICGPAPFMAIAEDGVRAAGVGDERVHLERFTPVEANAAEEAQRAEPAVDAVTTEVTVRLGGRKVTVPYRPGTTLLQTARFADLKAPSSCESGSCATCIARVTSGEARMRNNEALTDDEVAEGWVLTCQAEPVSPTITVVYE